jgi:hypothetical protein
LSESLTSVNAVLARFVARYDPSADLVPLEDFAFSATIHVQGVPIAMLVECFAHPQRPVESSVQMATSVPRAIPRMEIVAEGWGESIFRALGVHARLASGDELFDGTFVVRAEPAVARQLLGETVRRALMAIAKDDVPRLLVDEGAATLTWDFEPTERALDAAVIALTTIRAAQLTLRLG